MNAAALLAPWHREFPGRLAGSVYAAPPAARASAARAMYEAGLGVHVDIMAEGEGLPAGVGFTELEEIACAVPSGFDVHLIGSPAFVDAALPQVLTYAPAKVFLPWAAFSEERSAAIRAAGGSAWVALWQEWDALSEPEPRWPAAPDGVLVMLIEPGSRDRCRVERLAIVAACAAGLPVIVDGGVTEDVAPLCVTAGAEAMVVGRALLAGTAYREEA